jgi:hypothetical protein
MVTHYNALYRRWLACYPYAQQQCQSTYLSLYYVDGARKDVTAEHISKHLKLAAGLLNYPTRKGIPVERVDTHSLQGGGAHALALSGYSETAIQKMGQ